MMVPRSVLAIGLAVCAAACGPDERPARREAAPRRADDAAAPPPVIAPERAGRYRLTAARADRTRAVPGEVTTHVIIGADGTLWRAAPDTPDDTLLAAPDAPAAALLAAPDASRVATDAPDATARRAPCGEPLVASRDPVITLRAHLDAVAPSATLVLADRAAPAYRFAEVIRAWTHGWLGVAGDPTAASAFRAAFAWTPVQPARTGQVIQVHVSEADIRVLVDGRLRGTLATTDGALDTAALEAAYGTAQASLDGHGEVVVAVLGPLAVGALVAVLDALVGAGVRDLVVDVFPPTPAWGTTGSDGPAARGAAAERKTSVPRLRLGSFTTSGGALDVDVIRRQVKRVTGRLTACYERALGTAPDLAGAAKSTWIIRADGTTADVHVDGPDRGVDACQRCVLETMIFPPPRDGQPVSVKLPFTMTTGR